MYHLNGHRSSPICIMFCFFSRLPAEPVFLSTCFFFQPTTGAYADLRRGKESVPERTLWVGAHIWGYVFESRGVAATWTA